MRSSRPGTSNFSRGSAVSMESSGRSARQKAMLSASFALIEFAMGKRDCTGSDRPARGRSEREGDVELDHLERLLLGRPAKPAPVAHPGADPDRIGELEVKPG